MGKQRKKSNKELRQEAQNIQIVVTSDNIEAEKECDNQKVTVIKNTTKNLAFEEKVEYSTAGDVFNQVRYIFRAEMSGARSVFL